MEPAGLHTCVARYWPGGGRMTVDNKIVVFQDTQIRKIWYDDEWYFSVVDIVKALTDSPNPRQYWGKVKDRAFKSFELSPIWVRLKLPAEDSKMDRGLICS